MRRHKATDIDNRNAGEMDNYREDAMKALRKRIKQLEEENEILQNRNIELKWQVTFLSTYEPEEVNS